MAAGVGGCRSWQGWGVETWSWRGPGMPTAPNSWRPFCCLLGTFWVLVGLLLPAPAGPLGVSLEESRGVCQTLGLCSTSFLPSGLEVCPSCGFAASCPRISGHVGYLGASLWTRLCDWWGHTHCPSALCSAPPGSVLRQCVKQKRSRPHWASGSQFPSAGGPGGYMCSGLLPGGHGSTWSGVWLQPRVTLQA